MPAGKSETHRKLLEQVQRLSNNLKMSDSVSEKPSTNLKLVQASAHEELMRGRSSSHSSRNARLMGNSSAQMPMDKPASGRGSRFRQEEPEEFQSERLQGAHTQQAYH